MASSLIWFGISALASTLLIGGVWIFIKKSIVDPTTTEVEELKVKASELDQVLTKAANYADALVPSSEIQKISTAIDGLVKELSELSSKRNRLEEEIVSVREMISRKEAELHLIKKSNLDAEVYVVEIKAQQELIGSEFEKANKELNDCYTQLTLLEQEITLTDSQKAFLSEVQTAFKEADVQITDLHKIYEQSVNRFVNLENQHKELQKEFDRLAAKNAAENAAK